MSDIDGAKVMTDEYSVKDALRVAVLTLPGKSWPTFDGGNLKRWQYVSASEASKCVRSLAFGKQKEQKAVHVPDFWDNITDDEFLSHLERMPDDDSRGIFERGNEIEAWAVKRLLASVYEDEEYLFVGDGQVSFYTNKKRVSGTTDGIYVNHSTMTFRVLEFKSSNSPVTAPKYGNANQLLVNMGLISFLIDNNMVDEAIDFPLSSYTMLPGKLLYIDSSNYLSMTEFDIEYDGGEAFIKAASKAKALFIMKDGELALRDPSELVPEGLATPNGCWFCPFKTECGEIEYSKHDAANIKKLNDLSARIAGRSEVPKMPTFKSMSHDQAITALSHYYKFKQDEKRAKNAAKELSEAIKKWCEDEGISAKVKFQDGDDVFEVTYTKVSRIGNIDKDALNGFLEEQGLIQTDASFRKPPSESERLTVKVTPEEAHLHRDLQKAFADDDDDEDEDEDE